MPRSGGWGTVWDFLRDRYGVDEAELARRSSAGELVLESGHPVDDTTTYRPGSAVFIRRDAPAGSSVSRGSPRSTGWTGGPPECCC